MRKILALMCLCLFMLMACHHQNPLTVKTKSQSANFLMQASANVEKRLHFHVKKDERGYGYLECMEDKRNPEIDCSALFKGIVAFAKEGHFPGFESISKANITDKAVFANLKDDYYEIMATTWPHYFEGTL